MKALISNAVLTMSANSDCQNLPEFEVSYLQRPNLITHCLSVDSLIYEHYVGSAFILSYYDNGTVKYGSYYTDSNANISYGAKFYIAASKDGESKYTGRTYEFKSGWESRASVMNRQFNLSVTEVNQGVALDVFDLIPIVNEQYIGKVFLSFYSDEMDIVYALCPYDEDNINKFNRDATDYKERDNYVSLVLDVQDIDFISKAYNFYEQC